METGRRSLTQKTLYSISRALNVNLEWLQTGKGEMFNSNTPRLGGQAQADGADGIDLVAAAIEEGAASMPPAEQLRLLEVFQKLANAVVCGIAERK